MTKVTQLPVDLFLEPRRRNARWANVGIVDAFLARHWSLPMPLGPALEYPP